MKPEEFWGTSPREFDNLVRSWIDEKRQDFEVSRTLTFSAARWQAAQIAGVWNKKAGMAIMNYKFTWEKKSQGSKSKMPYKNMQVFLNAISKHKPTAQA